VVAVIPLTEELPLERERLVHRVDPRRLTHDNEGCLPFPFSTRVCQLGEAANTMHLDPGTRQLQGPMGSVAEPTRKKISVDMNPKHFCEHIGVRLHADRQNSRRHLKQE
jgi:hypothetical protein